MLKNLQDLFTRSGELSRGSGLLSGVIALVLAILAVLSVLAFHFPEYLTTPELRQKYSVPVLRDILLVGMSVAGGIAVTNILLGRTRWLNAATALLLLVAVAMGGHRVPVEEFPVATPYLGLDYLILSILGSAVVFVAIEKLIPLRRGQPVFRFDWQTDFVHFTVNHLLVGLALLIVNFFVDRLFSWAIYPPLQGLIQATPYLLEVFMVLLVADFIQYWTHRAYHEVPLLWRFHAVHHSTKVMDWMAGSRMHFFELIVTRVAILGPLYVLGFSKEAMDAYIVIVGFQAVFNHANVRLPWGPLKYLIVTPDFHHWHHGSDRAAIDRNYAAHFAFLDYLFGTAVKSDKRFPDDYGVLGDYMPQGFVRQQMFPFTFREKRDD